MYPQAELADLARAKTELRQAIACRRRQTAEALDVVTRPLGWLDQAHKVWRRIAPFVTCAAWPAGAVALSAMFRPPRILRRLLRWAPPVFRVVMALRRLRRQSRAPVTAA